MQQTDTIFEQATRAKTRFPSARGALNVEQLWDVPLRSKDDFNLNQIAKSLSGALKDVAEENFVEASSRDPRRGTLEASLTLVKFVIDTKLEEEEIAERRSENRAEKAKLLEILSRKQDAKLEEMSEQQIQKKIRALSE